MKKHIATLASLLLVFGLGACLLSLTESFQYDLIEAWEKFHPGEDYIDLDGSNNDPISIDLRDNSTFEEHQDEIKNVDRIGFEADLYTKDDQDAVIDFYFRLKDPDPWVLLLENVAVPGSSTAAMKYVITYKNSEKLIKNFEPFQELARKGVMEMKLVARNGNDQVRITRLILDVTLTAGK